jgi:hypothetical protein
MVSARRRASAASRSPHTAGSNRLRQLPQTSPTRKAPSFLRGEADSSGRKSAHDPRPRTRRRDRLALPRVPDRSRLSAIADLAAADMPNPGRDRPHDLHPPQRMLQGRHLVRRDRKAAQMSGGEMLALGFNPRRNLGLFLPLTRKNLSSRPCRAGASSSSRGPKPPTRSLSE